MLNKITFEGTLITGEGNGKKYLMLLWVKQQIEQKLGYTPYLGTLNLELTKKSAERRKLLTREKAIAICPAEGYCTGSLFKASIRGLGCAVVVPEVKGYPENMLEVIAPVNIRETLKLKDGDAVTVSVQV